MQEKLYSQFDYRDIGKRIRFLRGKESQADFGAKLGRSYTDIGRIERGNVKPTPELLFRICTLYDKSMEWLLTGEGPKHKEAVQTNAQPETQPIYKEGSDAGADYFSVPRYNISAGAGGGAFIENERIIEYIPFRKKWIKLDMGLEPEKLAVISVIGDSMEPTMAKGDLLLIDLRINRIKDDAIYVLGIDDTLLAKRIQRMYDGGVMIKSDNPIYEKQLIPKDKTKSLRIIGRVVWIGKRV